MFGLAFIRKLRVLSFRPLWYNSPRKILKITLRLSALGSTTHDQLTILAPIPNPPSQHPHLSIPSQPSTLSLQPRRALQTPTNAELLVKGGRQHNLGDGKWWRAGDVHGADFPNTISQIEQAWRSALPFATFFNVLRYFNEGSDRITNDGLSATKASNFVVLYHYCSFHVTTHISKSSSK